MAKFFYDLDEIRNISILDVCEHLGVLVEKQGSSVFCKLRDERTASCRLYLNNSNGKDSFYDFGASVGGDVIKFVAEYKGLTWQSALEELASMFGIEPVNNIEFMTRTELTDLEYSKIGVYGDRATKNFDFDLDNFSLESNKRFSEKYSMPVNELRKLYPDIYALNVLRKKAIPFVYRLRNDYYFELFNVVQSQKNYYGSFNIEKVLNDELEDCSKACKEVILAEKLLDKALKGTDITYSFKEYDVKSDMQHIHDGKISFEIGPCSYVDIKRESKVLGTELVNNKKTAITVNEYFELGEHGINTVPHAAFVQGEKVNLVYLPENAPYIDMCIDTYRKDVAERQKNANNFNNKEVSKVIEERDVR